jgi:hypothetical protein
MGKTCGIYQREQKYILGIDQETWGKIPLKRRWHMWKDNITMGLTETGWDGTYWIRMVQDKDKWLALVSMVMNYWVQQNVCNFLASWETASFSRMTLLHAVSYFYIPPQYISNWKVWTMNWPYSDPAILLLHISIAPPHWV